MKHTAILILMALTGLFASAHGYIMIGQTTNIFTEPTQGEPMVNQFDEVIDFLPGMVFAVRDENDDYWSVDMPGWKGVWVPKKACAAPETLDFTPATYKFEYEDYSRNVEFTPGKTEGTFRVTDENGTVLDATMVEPGILVLTDPRWPEEVCGSVARTGGKLRVWIYDTTILPWN